MGEKDKTSSDEEKKDPEVSAIESLQSQMKEVLAITRQQYGRQDQQKTDFASYKCYNCNRMGHIRSQCRIPVQMVHPTSRIGQGQGRGRANTRGRHLTRRGQFGRNIGFGQGGWGRSAFEISDINDWINDWEEEDWEEEGNYPTHSGNNYWGN